MNPPTDNQDSHPKKPEQPDSNLEQGKTEGREGLPSLDAETNSAKPEETVANKQLAPAGSDASTTNESSSGGSQGEAGSSNLKPAPTAQVQQQPPGAPGPGSSPAKVEPKDEMWELRVVPPKQQPPGQPPLVLLPKLPENESKDPAFELYKLEYERGAQRYNEIYQAIWTNFSYMAIVAGGILTFASNYVPPPTTVFFACMPLIFWYWASYEPMNRYGYQVEERLSWIEKILNRKYNLYNSIGCEILDEHLGLRHYTKYSQTRQKSEEALPEKTKALTKDKEPSRKLKAAFTILIVFNLIMWIVLYSPWPQWSLDPSKLRDSLPNGPQWLSIILLILTICIVVWGSWDYLKTVGCELKKVSKKLWQKYLVIALAVPLLVSSLLLLRKAFDLGRSSITRALFVIALLVTAYFGGKISGLWLNLKESLQIHRVRTIVRIFAVIVHIVAIGLLSVGIYRWAELNKSPFVHPDKEKTLTIDLKEYPAKVSLNEKDFEELKKTFEQR